MKNKIQRNNDFVAYYAFGKTGSYFTIIVKINLKDKSLLFRIVSFFVTKLMIGFQKLSQNFTLSNESLEKVFVIFLKNVFKISFSSQFWSKIQGKGFCF